MTFEKALEAMRNGKRVVRKGWDCNYELCMLENTIISYPLLDHIPYLRTYDISSFDWEICGECLKEPEMTVGHAIEVLESVRKSYRCFPDIDGVINFAIEAIEKQNLEEDEDLNSDNESANIKRAHKKYTNVIRNLHILLDFYKDNDFYRPKIIDAIECLKRDTEPEHKCNTCHCNCSDTGKNSDLQVEMEQVLSRRFFELADTTTDSLDTSNMIEIYRLMFEVK